MNTLNRYKENIKKLPKPGGGGAHQAIFTAGCYGFRAKKTIEEVIADIREHLPKGTRHVSDSEIAEGVKAGFADAADTTRESSSCGPLIKSGMLEMLIKEGEGTTEEDIINLSPVPIDWPENETGWRVLDALYGDDEYLFIGDRYQPGVIGQTIRRKQDWVGELKKHKEPQSPHIMANPLSGKPALKKSGDGDTLRGDLCIASHRFVVAEFDQISIDDQLAFWYSVKYLPVAALIHSGNKSIHAWLRVNCVNSEEWGQEIENKLFPGFLAPLGLDPACKNASRLSRMPGHRRNDTGLIQRCLYLAPQGKAVN